MCSNCRHPEIGKILKSLHQEIDLDSVFGGDMKECQKYAARAIREGKIERREQRKRGESTWAIDARLRALRFGVWVLTRGREEERKGETPFLNGYRSSPHSGPGAMWF